MGIEVAIDKTEGKNKEDSLIVNQIISSGILQENKYEIFIEEYEYNINKKYVIINNEDEDQEKFIEEIKELISKHIEIPEKDIIIVNIREDYIALDVALKNTYDIDIREKMKELAKLKKIKSIYEKNILGACKLTQDMLDERGNKDPSEWLDTAQNRGGFTYYPPTHNWVGYGLKVLDEYDVRNNDWIAKDNNPNEWAVAFHGTSSSAVKPNLPVVIMCRVNPKLIRIPQGEYGKKEWITDGTRKTIRPYRILINVNKNKQLDNNNNK